MGPNSATNHIQFKSCNFKYASGYSIDWSNGKNTRFENCDFELNGVSGDTTTGVIKIKNNIGVNLGDFQLVTFEACWFEGNGGYLIWLQESDNAIPHQSSITRCSFQYNVGSPDMTDIKIVGHSQMNKLILDSNNFADARTLIAEGDSCWVTFRNSVGRTVINRGASILYPIDEFGHINPPSGSTPADQSTAQGWATIYVGGTEYRIKLYQ